MTGNFTFLQHCKRLLITSGENIITVSLKFEVKLYTHLFAIIAIKLKDFLVKACYCILDKIASLTANTLVLHS